MKAKDVAVILSAAVVTAVAVVALLGPAAQAVAPSESAHPRTTLQLEHAMLWLDVQADSCKPGVKPVVVLEAFNSDETPRTISVTVTMTATQPNSRMSRMVMMPKVAWQQVCSMDLGPGETRSIELTSEAAVPAGQVVSFTVQADGKAAATGEFGAEQKLAENVSNANYAVLPVEQAQ